MKKLNIGIGIMLLTLVGCSTLEKKETSLPVVERDFSGRTFLPQVDIISPQNNVKIITPLQRCNLNGVDEVSIARKKIKNGKAYLENSSVPFTGTFYAYLGIKKLYSESYVAGLLDGSKIWYSEYGNIGLIERYSKGIRNGLEETYYRSTGKIKSKIPYINGKISGVVQWFDKDGNIIYSENFINGTGNWKSFWDNEQVKDIGRLVNGQKNGEWKSYMKNGDLEKKMIYKNGSLLKQHWYQ